MVPVRKVGMYCSYRMMNMKRRPNW